MPPRPAAVIAPSVTATRSTPSTSIRIEVPCIASVTRRVPEVNGGAQVPSDVVVPLTTLFSAQTPVARWYRAA